MKAAVDERHRKEVEDAYTAVDQLRLAAKVSAGIGAVAVVWVVLAMVFGDMDVAEGIVVLAGAALATIVPASSLYAASFRTSLGAARLERSLVDD